MASCKGCGAEISWGRTQNGANIPLDRISKDHYMGTVTEFPMGFDTFYVAPVRVVYRSHFLTCKKANEFSKKTKEKKDAGQTN